MRPFTSEGIIPATKKGELPCVRRVFCNTIGHSAFAAEFRLQETKDLIDGRWHENLHEHLRENCANTYLPYMQIVVCIRHILYGPGSGQGFHPSPGLWNNMAILSLGPAWGLPHAQMCRMACLSERCVIVGLTCLWRQLSHQQTSIKSLHPRQFSRDDHMFLSRR